MCSSNGVRVFVVRGTYPRPNLLVDNEGVTHDTGGGASPAGGAGACTQRHSHTFIRLDAGMAPTPVEVSAEKCSGWSRVGSNVSGNVQVFSLGLSNAIGILSHMEHAYATGCVYKYRVQLIAPTASGNV